VINGPDRRKKWGEVLADRLYKVTVGDTVTEVAEGTSYGDIIGNYDGEGAERAVLVYANGILQELPKTVAEDVRLEPVLLKSRVGFDTYKRSLNLLFLKALYDLCGKEDGFGVFLHFSNANGYYYTLDGRVEASEALAEKVAGRMRELCEKDIPIVKRTVKTREAQKLFSGAGLPDKKELFAYRRVSRVPLYSIEDYEDYFYGYMVSSTGFLKYFDVAAYGKGLVLVLPEAGDPTVVRPFAAYPKIFRVQEMSEEWGAQMEINSVCDLNRSITMGTIGHKMLVSEALQESRISDIAAEIKARGNVKFVMIAGPSSSGKTTFSRRLSIQLSAHGLNPYPISLDNFYKDRALCPKNPDGSYDFECLEAIDVDLIREDLQKLLKGEEVLLPRFNFLTGQREFKDDRLQLKEKDILVIEGIHGLNNALSDFLPPESKYRIYISAMTQLNVDEHNHISTTDGRLLRRMVRDNMHRGTTAQETIAMWPSVRKGERDNIFPHQENADTIFNSALIYELSILKTYAEPLLFQIPEGVPEYQEAKRLLRFLDYFLGMPSENVPKNSILREFIGGSCFDV